MSFERKYLLLNQEVNELIFRSSPGALTYGIVLTFKLEGANGQMYVIGVIRVSYLALRWKIMSARERPIQSDLFRQP